MRADILKLLIDWFNHESRQAPRDLRSIPQSKLRQAAALVCALGARAPDLVVSVLPASATALYQTDSNPSTN
jgi:hypothetical protein